MLLETLKHVLRDILNYFNFQETITSIVWWFVNGMALGRLADAQLEISLNPDSQLPSPEASDFLLSSEIPNLPTPSDHLTPSETSALETDSEMVAHMQIRNFSSAFLQGRTSWEEMPPGEDSDAVKLAIEANLKEAMRVSNVTLSTDILFENHCCDSFVRPDAIFELREMDSLLTLAGEHVAGKQGSISEPLMDKKWPFKTAEGRLATSESARVASKPKSNTISEEDQNLATKREKQCTTSSEKSEEKMLSRLTAHCVPATTEKNFDITKTDTTPATSSKKKRKNKKKKKMARSPSPPPTACPGPNDDSGETCPPYELCPQLAPWAKDKMYPSTPRSTKNSRKGNQPFSSLQRKRL